MYCSFKRISFYLCLLFSFSQFAHASPEFETAFLKILPELKAHYEPINVKKEESRKLELQVKTAWADYSMQLQSPNPNPDPMVIFAAVTKWAQLNKESQKLCEEWPVLESEYRDKYILPLVNKYAWAIPNDAAIKAISGYGPLIELGAGSGYWAQLLKLNGVDIVASDDQSWQGEQLHKQEKLWFDKMQKGSVELLSLAENVGRTLFISWPPKDVDFAFSALTSYQGSIFIYVGEIPMEGHPYPAMGNSKFFKLLLGHFKIKETIDIPNWPGYLDKVYIFERTITEPVL